MRFNAFQQRRPGCEGARITLHNHRAQARMLLGQRDRQRAVIESSGRIGDNQSDSVGHLDEVGQFGGPVPGKAHHGYCAGAHQAE
ncbi:Uncharacterised protein [Mycobacteroides abscessus subsp. massiliense]|nr:Uncharacterised protein [Mycobacteroides abscessus subsp. massiliense]